MVYNKKKYKIFVKNKQNFYELYMQIDELQRKELYKMPDVLFSVFPNEQFVDLTVYQNGYEKCAPMHGFGPNVRNHFLFHYIISGKGTLRGNGKNMTCAEYQLSAGSGFLIEPGYVNHYWADKEDPWEYIWIEFGGLRAREYMESAGLSQTQPVYQPEKKEDGLKVLEEMFAVVKAEENSWLYQIGHLYLFIDTLIRTSQTRKRALGGKLREFYVREAINYIEDHYSENVTIEDMARFCKLDRSYFGKVFKSVVGQSPQEFLIRYRMEKAVESLVLTDAAISDISVSVGYANSLHFSRAFKGVYGIPPREYRKKHKLVKR